jgi:hypothetical protein
MILAKPTTYGGIEYRSILESKYAILFDLLGWTAHYEPERFVLAPQLWYTPDFWVDDLQVYLEIKPVRPDLDDLALRKCAALSKQTGKIVHLLYGNVATFNILTFVHLREGQVSGMKAGGYHGDTTQWCTCRGRIALRMCTCSRNILTHEHPDDELKQRLNRAVCMAETQRIGDWRLRPLADIEADEEAQRARARAAYEARCQERCQHREGQTWCAECLSCSEEEWAKEHEHIRRRR